jgi:hypothetical protein
MMRNELSTLVEDLITLAEGIVTETSTSKKTIVGQIVETQGGS